jgi:hypothetical protein
MAWSHAHVADDRPRLSDKLRPKIKGPHLGYLSGRVGVRICRLAYVRSMPVPSCRRAVPFRNGSVDSATDVLKTRCSALGHSTMSTW